ncbi:MAG: response regulator [Elusimicrobiaceae bacterium]|nr:response regulator [Elusimicrobiaceae bacterium]
MAKLILIEDSKNLALALKGALELNGHEVIWVSDGRDGLMAVKKNKPDGVLLDLMLPHISGFEICKAIKTDSAIFKTPVIIMSTLTDYDSKQRIQEAGADYFIEKPYNLKETLAQINKCLPKTK